MNADDIASTSSGDLYTSSGHILYKSEDGGDSWYVIHNNINVQKIETYGSDTLFLGTSEGYLIYSGDGGISFNQLHSFGSRIYTIKYVNYTDSSLIIIGTNNGYVHASKDFGSTWNSQLISTGYVYSVRYIQNRIYAATSKGLFYSDDEGLSWTQKIVLQADEPVFDIAMDSLNNLYVSADYDVYKSTDSGNSWSLSLNQLVFVIKISPEGELYAGEYRSLDQGTTWDWVIPSQAWYLCFRDSVTYMSTTELNYNLFREELHPYMGSHYFPLTIGNEWLFTRSYVYNSGTGGTEYSYSLKEFRIMSDTVILGIRYLNVENAGIFRYGADNKLYKWQDSTEHIYMDFNLYWGNTFQFFGTTAQVNDGYINIFNCERFYKEFEYSYSTRDRTYRTYVDSIGPQSYSSWYHYPMGAYTSSSESLINALIIYEGSLHYYSDHYKPQINFTPIDSTGTLIVNLNFNVDHHYSKFSTTGTSRNFIKDVWLEYYYSKEDSSTNKDSLNCTISEYSTDCWVTILLDSSRVTDGYKFNYAIYARDKALMPEISRSPETGYYQLEYEQEPTGINEKKNNMYSFVLSQNYPNPFNPTTMIQYAIGSRQFVSLKVYDVLGNEVAKLVNDDRPAGSYTVEFNGSNLASGIYFYQLKAGSYTATRKLILLK